MRGLGFVIGVSVLFSISFAKANPDVPLKKASINHIFSCLKALQKNNTSTFPHNDLAFHGDAVVLPMDHVTERPNKIILLTGSQITCAKVPEDGGSIREGGSLLQFDPRDFGVDEKTFLTTLSWSLPGPGDKEMKRNFNKPLPVGNGGPSGGIVSQAAKSQFKVFEVRPTSCFPGVEVNKSVFHWLDEAIRIQSDLYKYNLKYLNQEPAETADFKEERLKALNSCRGLDLKLDSQILPQIEAIEAAEPLKPGTIEK